MKIPEHVALSYLLAQFGLQQQYGPEGTALAVAAGCLPDLDGLGIVAGGRFYRTYHRVVGHGLPLTLAGPALLAWLGSAGLALGPFWPLWGWLQAAFLAHLATDVLFYRWPALLLWPLSRRGWAVGLLSWNDLVPTLLLYGGALAALVWPAHATAAAAVALGGLVGYLLWRAAVPRPDAGLGDWLAGGWAHRSPRVWRWLTGDFVT